MDIEDIQGWAGTEVVDRDGEKIGKLEDVHFETVSGEARFGCVKTGFLGRSLKLVPLAGATLSREHVRVAYTREQVKDAPSAEAGAALEPAAETELARHYGMDLDSAGERRYESGSVRTEREEREREANERADELERVAERKADEARQGEASAEEGQRRAREAEAERERALEQAAQARREGKG